jgi:hypothetical protein
MSSGFLATRDDRPGGEFETIDELKNFSYSK